MKKVNLRTLFMYVIGSLVVSAVVGRVFNPGIATDEWIWRSLFLGVVGGLILYFWDENSSAKKKK